MAGPRLLRDPHDAAASAEVVDRGLDPVESGHEIDSFGVVGQSRDFLALRRTADEFHGFQPIDGVAGRVRASLGQMNQFRADLPANHRVESGDRRVGLCPDVEVKKRPGSDRQLDVTGGEAALAEHGGLLVSYYGADRDPGSEPLRIAFSEVSARIPGRGEQSDRNAEKAANKPAPSESVRVVQAGRASARVFRHKQFVIGQLPNYPRVKSPEADFPFARRLLQLRVFLEKPKQAHRHLNDDIGSLQFFRYDFRIIKRNYI